MKEQKTKNEKQQMEKQIPLKTQKSKTIKQTKRK